MKDYSNYHNTDFKSKVIHDGNILFEQGLNGFDGYEVTVNEVISRAIITSKFNSGDGTEKNIIGKVADIERGNVILVNETNENWIVISIPKDNNIYRKAVIKLCNSTFSLPGEKTKVLIGQDPRTGRPIYDEQVTQIEVPCIVESQYSKSSDVNQFKIPEGTLVISMKYQTSEELKIDYDFEMYGNKYKVANFDYTSVIDDKGIIKIIAEKVV
ncbi:hypothetical protein [Metabacillus arenae]|uniref:Uncharacterized protein n=1 Tax=Metabacillus arenae TaxID=2771434 RepID=A0A926NEW7_9BACI|nr:hypothetical protein [Metabacillus arenae]MBD1379213.1 hypothetical protein [Metabacillus arenae]